MSEGNSLSLMFISREIEHKNQKVIKIRFIRKSIQRLKLKGINWAKFCPMAASLICLINHIKKRGFTMGVTFAGRRAVLVDTHFK